MQNNRRGDIRAQASKLSGQHPTNTTMTIPRLTGIQPVSTSKTANLPRTNTGSFYAQTNRPPSHTNGQSPAAKQMHATGMTHGTGSMNRITAGNTTSRIQPVRQTALPQDSARIYPVKLPDARTTPPKRPRKPSKLRDFLLGLAIGFAVFGTAAIFVCRALIGIFEG